MHQRDHRPTQQQHNRQHYRRHQRQQHRQRHLIRSSKTYCLSLLFALSAHTADRATAMRRHPMCHSKKKWNSLAHTTICGEAETYMPIACAIRSSIWLKMQFMLLELMLAIIATTTTKATTTQIAKAATKKHSHSLCHLPKRMEPMNAHAFAMFEVAQRPYVFREILPMLPEYWTRRTHHSAACQCVVFVVVVGIFASKWRNNEQ